MKEERVRQIVREEMEKLLAKRTPRFKAPTKDEVFQEFTRKAPGNSLTAEQFYDHYEANGWMIGRNKMKNWKAAVAQWVARNNLRPSEAFKVTSEAPGSDRPWLHWKKDDSGPPEAFSNLMRQINEGTIEEDQTESQQAG